MESKTRTLVIILVALLVALAGCTGGPGDASDGDDVDEDESEDDAANESDGTDEPDASAGPDESGDGEVPGAIDTDDPTDPVGQSAFTNNKGQVVQSHAETLTASGSYTAVVNTTWSGSGDGFGGQTESVVSTTTTYANPSTGEYYQTTDIPLDEFEYRIESYSPPNENVTYTRTNVYGQQTYAMQEQVIDTSQHMRPASGSFYESLEFQSTGTVTRDGETLERYVVTDVQQVADSAYFQGSLATIDVEVLYNPERNLMQSVSWEYRYEDDAGERFSSLFRVAYEDIGSTTVPEPDWLDEARQQASGSDDGFEFDGSAPSLGGSLAP